MKFPFVGGAYAGRSPNVNAQTCRNLMVELDPTVPEGRVLVGTPGYAEVSTSAGTQVRHIVNDVLSTTIIYCVIDAELYSYDLTTGTFTAVSTVGGNTWSMFTSGGSVRSATMGLANGELAIAVADGGSLNVFNTTGANTATRVQVSLLDQSSNTVCFLDGRFIADDTANPGRFIYSDILAPGTWNAFNFATAEGAPDSLRAVFSNRRELYLFGERSIEVWYSTGDANNPFARYQGGFIEMGCAAPYTVCEIDNGIMWLATDKKGQIFVAAMGSNYQPIVMSPPGINYRLGITSKGFGSGVSTSSGVYAFVYRLAGHEIYVLRTLVDNGATTVTYCYDSTTKEWHEWGSGASGPHVALHASAAEYKNTLYGTYMASGDAKLYRLSPEIYTDNGAAIYRERTTVGVSDEQDRIKIAHLQIDMEEGVSTQPLMVDTLALAAPAGATTVVATGGTVLGVGRTLAVTLDDGRIHLATVTGGSAGTYIFANEPLVGPASIGNVVEGYPSDRCTIETSKDGGQTWGTATSLHMGVATTKARRVLLRKLGMARHWVLRWKTSAAVKIVIRGVVAKLWGEA